MTIHPRDIPGGWRLTPRALIRSAVAYLGFDVVDTLLVIALHDHGEDDGVDCLITQSELATMMGVHRVTLVKRLARLEKRGLIIGETRRTARGWKAGKIYSLQPLFGALAHIAENRQAHLPPSEGLDTLLEQLEREAMEREVSIEG